VAILLTSKAKREINCLTITKISENKTSENIVLTSRQDLKELKRIKKIWSMRHLLEVYL